MLWDQMDYFLERAALGGLFANITPHWVKYKGADILELRGKRTSLTAKHVLTRDEVLLDSQNGYRTNNKIQNQVNLELFKDFDSETDEDVLHVVLQHGGRGERFAHLKAYFANSVPLSLSGDIMLIPDLEKTEESETVSQPSVTLKEAAAQENPEVSRQVSMEVIEDEHSQP